MLRAQIHLWCDTNQPCSSEKEKGRDKRQESRDKQTYPGTELRQMRIERFLGSSKLLAEQATNLAPNRVSRQVCSFPLGVTLYFLFLLEKLIEESVHYLLLLFIRFYPGSPPESL